VYLERNEFLHRIESGLELIPPLEYSTYALFDAERIEAVRKEKEVDRRNMLELNFKYLIDVSGPDPKIGVRELIVDAKTSQK
jgi:hypothetical protein